MPIEQDCLSSNRFCDTTEVVAIEVPSSDTFMYNTSSYKIPGIHRTLLHSSLTLGQGWRYPLYLDWFLNREFLQYVNKNGVGEELGFFQRLLYAPFAKYLSAAYIEWRYYAIISNTFHGIVGVSLFNPEEHFSWLAEGGLLVIVAGVIDSAREPGEFAREKRLHGLKEFCWMKLFPIHLVEFQGSEKEHISVTFEEVEFRLEQVDIAKANIFLSGAHAPAVLLTHAGLENTAIAPVLAEDLKLFPGTHWIAHIPSPIAEVTGTISLSPEFLKSQIFTQTVNYYPSFISAQLEKLKHIGLHLQLKGADGYYEHSFGMNPLPFHGWDFLLVPDAQARTGLVMQAYRHSCELRLVEVIWRENGESRYLRFCHDDMKLTWENVEYNSELRVTLPSRRRIVGNKDGYRLEVSNTISTVIPFLRPEKFVMRNFFISEEVSFTSWRLLAPGGKVVVDVANQPSSGENASFVAKNFW
jgi:hypothetical protein